MAEKKKKSSDLEIKSKKVDWHAIHADEVVSRLKTPSDSGLSSEEASRRLIKFGPNRLAEKPPTGFIKMVFNQLNNFLVILLIVAAVVSALIGDEVEAAAIIIIVVLNAVLGVIQESRA